jgi:hypothetical protein
MTMKTRFSSSDGKVFVVEEVRQVGQELWVHYYNDKTGQQYSCLLDAFSQRFFPLADD